MVLPAAFGLSLSVPPFGSAVGGSVGGFFGPITLAVGAVLGGMIGGVIKTVWGHKVPKYRVSVCDVDYIDRYFKNCAGSRKTIGNVGIPSEPTGAVVLATGGSPKGPRKNDDEEKRKVNTLEKPEAAKRIKDRYKSCRDGKYRLRERKQGFKDKRGREARMLEWDNTHKDWEAYESLDGKPNTHIGSLDPKTCEVYKPALESRDAR